MTLDPYAGKKLDTPFPCADKSTVPGRICAILDARALERGLQLAPFPSRAVLKHEVHELILTAEAAAGPGARVNQIAYLAFFEVLESGILWTGDRVLIAGREVGRLAGYDLTHFPNHLNLIVKTASELVTGLEAGIKVGDPLEFVFPGRGG
jgi:hypothetical protein